MKEQVILITKENGDRNMIGYFLKSKTIRRIANIPDVVKVVSVQTSIYL
jgi:hypothetical protein